MSKARWSTIRRKVIERDEGLCQRCLGAKRGSDHLTVHHIKPRAEGGLTEMGNLITLCARCHDWIETHDPFLTSRAAIEGSYEPPTRSVSSGLARSVDYHQAGYPTMDDSFDLWATWVRQGRTGAIHLVERLAA